VEWLANVGEIVLPGDVVMELIQGCRNREEQQRMKEKVESYRVTWPTEISLADSTAGRSTASPLTTTTVLPGFTSAVPARGLVAGLAG
jgi:hypothetical protein